MTDSDYEALIRQFVAGDRSAMTARDRQIATIAEAYLAGDGDRVHLLARDHLADHPDSPLVTWMAATATAPREIP